MLNNLLQTFDNGRGLVDRGFKEDFLTGTKKLLTEIECKVHNMLRVINDAFVQHDKAVRDIVSRGKCPNNASVAKPLGNFMNLTDQHREYLLSKRSHRLILDSCPVNPSIIAH